MLLGSRIAGVLMTRLMGPPSGHRFAVGWNACGRLLGGLLVVVTAACSLSQPAPVKSAFLLDTNRAADERSAPFPGVLLVGDFDVAQSFAGRPMVYRFDEHRYESDFYNEFFVSPREMLGQRVLEWLQSARLYDTVAPLPGSRALQADQLRGLVNEMYADVRDPAHPAAVLSIQFYVTRPGHDGEEVLFAQQLRMVAPMRDASAEAYTEALSSALEAVLSEFERQVRPVLAKAASEGSALSQRGQ
jgi:cholesterol transport system auxiliary component